MSKYEIWLLSLHNIYGINVDDMFDEKMYDYHSKKTSYCQNASYHNSADSMVLSIQIVQNT
jgi:hypothetical protein